MQTLNSLCSQVLKARYFPSSTFLEADLSYNPSLTWRSILAGRKVLEKGLTCRIGDGQTTMAFRDNWIPNFSPTEVLNSCIRHCPNLLVYTLMSSQGVWNREAICVFFPPAIANSILVGNLQVPVNRSPLVQDPLPRWSPPPFGCFRVNVDACGRSDLGHRVGVCDSKPPWQSSRSLCASCVAVYE
ncbi:retrotransposon protein, putative, unclassified [Senna tora]|uniref:Retrotransposon protein, putative, unclassified n=1 Tax=Senna tora TaxID=362788 RepID=A0A834WPU2_9FABA|nr:retrotransposon protein, putative, unclassified [Senna tora]